MEYKGFKAAIIYDYELEVFRGRIIDIRDVITFQGASVDELKENMVSTIDEYIELCNDLQRKRK